MVLSHETQINEEVGEDNEGLSTMEARTVPTTEPTTKPKIESSEPKMESPEPKIESPERQIKSPGPKIESSEPKRESPEPKIESTKLTNKPLEPQNEPTKATPSGSCQAINDDIDGTINFLGLIGRLKHMPRRGWSNQNVDNCERISGHMYRMVIMSLIYDQPELDMSKCLQMCAIHDMAEALVGDITPHDNVSSHEKQTLEIDAMQAMTQTLPHVIRDKFLAIFDEYEKRTSPEARFVKELDRVELLTQAFEYEKLLNTPGRFDEFFRSNTTPFQFTSIQNYYDRLLHVRDTHTFTHTDRDRFVTGITPFLDVSEPQLSPKPGR